MYIVFKENRHIVLFINIFYSKIRLRLLEPLAMLEPLRAERIS
jgi:hypothetical protein